MNLLKDKPTFTLRFLIWLSLVPTLIGHFFKVMHWPGAGVLMILGSFIFAFFYLPVFAIENLKNKTGFRAKALFFSQLVIILIFALGFIFIVQKWAGAGVFKFLTNKLLFFVLTPYAIYHLVKSSKINIEKTHYVFILIFFFSYCFSLLINSNTGKINIDAVLQQGANTEEALKIATSRNNQLYKNFKDVTKNQNADLSFKINKLKSLTDSAVNHIRDIKSNLLVKIDKISKQQADTISSLNIENKVDYDITTFILIGDEFNLKSDKFSALALKKTINNYREGILNLIQEQNRPIVKEGLNLNTDNYEDDENNPVTWEIANFSHMPLLYVYNYLTSIQYEIKNAEYQALTDIVNSENEHLNSALFNEIAVLNSKFDAAKKQEEILKLQNANEKGLELLNEKQSELASSRNTIIIFILILLVFVILVFFTIRSNILRRKINKKLIQQNEIIESQKSEVETQKHIVEEKQKEIIDSISYAKRLQEAILPPADFLSNHLENYFILYKPKDIVAGDFYWAENIKLKSNLEQDLFFIAAADSTGHGVPGAMVSVVCSNALNRSVKEFNLTDTGKILDKTRQLVIETFEKSNSDVKDGMDISLLCINKSENKLFWSGANNPLWIIKQNKLIEIKPNKQPIGKSENPKPFITHELEYSSDTTFYLFTDGFADQFGGPKGKKFMYKQFENLLLSIAEKPMHEQKSILNDTFISWKNDLEQVDDVCVIGIKI